MYNVHNIWPMNKTINNKKTQESGIP